MTPDQKALLEPLATAYAAIENIAINASDEQLAELEKACAAASQTNCWACTFRVAQLLLPVIRSQRLYRARLGADLGRTG